MKNAPQAPLAMPVAHHQGSRPVHVGGIQGLARNAGLDLNMELHQRGRLSPRDRFFATYSCQESSAAQQDSAWVQRFSGCTMVTQPI